MMMALQHNTGELALSLRYMTADTTDRETDSRSEEDENR